LSADEAGANSGERRLCVLRSQSLLQQRSAALTRRAAAMIIEFECPQWAEAVWKLLPGLQDLACLVLYRVI